MQKPGLQQFDSINLRGGPGITCSPQVILTCNPADNHCVDIDHHSWCNQNAFLLLIVSFIFTKDPLLLLDIGQVPSTERGPHPRKGSQMHNWKDFHYILLS